MCSGIVSWTYDEIILTIKETAPRRTQSRTLRFLSLNEPVCIIYYLVIYSQSEAEKSLVISKSHRPMLTSISQEPTRLS